MRTLAVALAGVFITVLAMTASADGRVPAQSQSAAPGAFASFPGRRIWYVDSGGPGVPVVFLHAATGSVLSWPYQEAAARAAGYRFIAFDRVGFGRSTLDAGANAGTAADDLQALITFLRIDRFHLIGTAAGGFVAFDYAISFPERLRSLTVANSIGGVQDEDYLALGRRIRPSPQFDGLPTEFKELGPSYRAGDPGGSARWVELGRLSRAAAPLAAPQTFRNRLTFALLETLRLPTLLLTGDADLYAPPPVLRMFAAHITGAESIVIGESGHSTYWERPDAFNHAVFDFIARH
jgi:pimeloyl-ACP methyl ester carboxylesterase